MKRLGGLVPVLLALVLGWLLSGVGSCAREGAPQLVTVTDVSPREVEVGDRVAIVGEGFPAGKPARITFRGTLRRPGERPERGAEIMASGAVLGPQQVELAFTDATQALFCGAGDRAAHTTFDGEVEVAFAAAGAGAPPVAGVLSRLTLDVRPAATPGDADRDREGSRLLAWIGAEAVGGASGLAITSIEPGSRADAAGLGAGDALVSFDGVRVATVGDLIPAPGEREATLVVRRASSTAEATRTVALDDFHRAPPADLLVAAPLVLVALVLVLLLGAPGRPSVAAALQRVVSRVRARPAGSLRATLLDALPPPGPFAAVDTLACALFAAMPFGQYLVAAQLDVGILFVAAAAILATAALVARGSAWRGLVAAAHVGWQHVPAALAVVTVVATTGSLRVQEIERAQGGWPWDWLAFRNPGTLVAFFVLLACARIEPDMGPSAGGVSALVDGLTGDPGPRAGWLRAACRAHRVLVAGLASALFLGGWLLPGVSPAEQAARPALQLLGTAWLLAKTWALVLAMAGASIGLPNRWTADRTRMTALWLAPTSLAALAVAAAWTWWSPAHATQLLASGALVVAVALVAPALTLRIRHGLLSPAGDGRVSPFL